ncbi:MAG TPA: LysR family transcriptional regulator, partial [Tistrella mobilis]|nr:LysR family transcriptional regulator [Tistrella mobilis]
ALSPRMVPMGAVDVGKRLGLPRLPRLPVVLHSRDREGQSGRAVAALVAAYRTAIR